jgi:hypothetical protein
VLSYEQWARDLLQALIISGTQRVSDRRVETDGLGFRMQSQFLHAPVQDLTDVELVF